MYSKTTVPPESDLEWPLFQQDIREASSGEPDWRSASAVWAFYAWKKGRSHFLPETKADSKTTPHTLGAFRGSFYLTNQRPPTEQEVFDAGMRAGRDIKWPEKKSTGLGELHPDGLTDKQMIFVLAQARRFALLAFKRIAEGHADPIKYAQLTLKHLDTPSTEYLISNEISKKDIEEIMDKIVQANPDGALNLSSSEPSYNWVSLNNLAELVSEALKKSKL